MPKPRTPSLFQNLRIELVVDPDDPTKSLLFATYDILDEDGALLSQERREIAITGSLRPHVAALTREVRAALLETHELTEEDVQTGKERRAQRRQEQEAAHEQRRQDREAALQEAAEGLRQQHAPLLEAEIEAAMERIRMQHPVLPVPDPDFPTPPEIIEDVLQKVLEEKERVRQEQIAAGEAYAREQAQIEQGRRESEAEDTRRQHEADGVPVPTATPPRRPQR